MKITTAKEFMQVIAKHYEECKEIYLYTMYNIPCELIDGSTSWIEGLPEDEAERHSVAIMLAIFAALTFESGEQEHTVAKDILLEVYDRFGVTMAIEKFVARGYMEWDKDKKDEYGFPAVNVIVPPDQWDINEEA